MLAWQLNRVVDYIESHLEHKITAKALAEISKVSTGRLFRAFKVSVGVTQLHYVTRRRIEFACTMMRTTREPLSQVAMAIGLASRESGLGQRSGKGTGARIEERELDRVTKRQ